jgi:ribonuclease P protein component
MSSYAQASADKAVAKRLAWCSLTTADFPLALAARPLAKSQHFVLHHVSASPSSPSRRASKRQKAELSTSDAPNRRVDVDNTKSSPLWWLGLVVPKRHARRSVTRSLLKRQMRIHANGHRHRLPPGQWIIRLRQAFDTSRYASAASAQLREAVDLELAHIFASVVTP